MSVALVQRSMASLQQSRPTNNEPQVQSGLDIPFSLATIDDLRASARILASYIPGLTPVDAETCLREFKFVASIDPVDEAKGIRLTGISQAVATTLVPGRRDPVMVHYLLYLAGQRHLMQAA